jgi:large subunit ribosomal protein L15
VKLHDLAPPKGATKAKHRVGRGTGGKGHKTAGRGTKGQKARSTVPAGFEGGQLPLMQRIPKLKGFHNPFRVAYTPVNLGALDALDALEASEITVATLVEAGLVRPKALVKVLGQGSISRPVKVSAHAFSKSAEAAITAAGGSVERVPLPFANGRPPASGNALMNR